MAKSRGLSPSDLQLWAAYSQSLVLLPGKTRLAVEMPPVAAGPPATPAKPPPPASPPARFSLGIGTPTGIDTATWRKFATGKISASRRLDLHGFTAAHAHQAVRLFIEQAYAEQQRCLEIITGKGEVLARELPHWLNAPALRPLILGLAHPHAANTGAVRILLRRRR